MAQGSVNRPVHARAAGSYSLRLRGPNNFHAHSVHAEAVKSGIHSVIVVILASVTALGASDAGRPGEAAGTQVWVAPGLGDYEPHTAALTFEPRASADPCGRTTRMVTFEWHATTGELSFTATKMAAPVTLPEDYVKVATLESGAGCTNGSDL
jgi:hypothetical protein